MPNLYSFKRLIKKYEVPVTMTTQGGHFDDETGRWVEGVPVTETLMLVVLPAEKSDVYQSGGRITSADRIIYSRSSLSGRDHIEFEGERWTLSQYGDYKTYADFYRYVATKEASA